MLNVSNRKHNFNLNRRERETLAVYWWNYAIELITTPAAGRQAKATVPPA
jgi:hypothetical protein